MNIRSHVLRVAAAAAIAGFVVLGAGGAAGSAGAQAGGSGPHFYSGVAVDVADQVTGDVYAAAQNLTISGDVTGDVIAAAQTITISGRVDGNIRLAGQDVTITGDVARSGTVFAGNLVVDGRGAIGEDVVATASAIRVDGSVGRDLVVSTNALRIDGTVGGDVTYSGERAAQISAGAVDGTVRHIEPQRPAPAAFAPWAAALGWFLGLLYALVGLSLITVAAGLLIPRVLHGVTDRLLPSPWRALLVGFVAAIVVPVGLLVLLVTVVGAPLALAGLLVWVVLTLATFLVGAHYLGRLMLRGAHHPVLLTFVGGLVLIVGLQIPLLNILVWLAMVFFGLGAELLALHANAPWRTRAEPPNAAPAVGDRVAGPSALATAAADGEARSRGSEEP
ncbi:polymer-forming cytoskeletal protein [uncultured Leifsonia sp.]|uniref:polymer-forming cytoskeletal protein n=1 Tax=uncultured Leifsonia sp. TaxID=340359 RepID=UPI0028D4C76B|nr:polymer-forming cytoskeletal protein [uncultured Leifsonia sp.]